MQKPVCVRRRSNSMMPSARKKRRSVSNPLKKSSAVWRKPSQDPQGLKSQRDHEAELRAQQQRIKVQKQAQEQAARTSGNAERAAEARARHAQTGLFGVAAPGVERARGAQKAQRASGYRGSVSASAAFFKGRAAIHPFGCPPMHIPAGGVLLQGRPASAGTRRATFFSSTSASIFTMTSERLSPPPRARERAFSIRNSVASRGERESTTEPSSVGEK